MNSIFSPLQLHPCVTLKNRLAVAPMTTQQSLPDGSLSREEAEWLARLSMDGYGMVISCAAAISASSIAFHNQLSLAGDTAIPALAGLAAKMRMNGCINVIQLCHGGSRTIETLTGEKPRSASSYDLPGIPGFVPPQELSVPQIGRIVEDFTGACARVEKAGFDGVELHGANGYLFTQFISTMTNQRTDGYGGSLENRARFAREVVRACRRIVPADFIIGFRLSFEGMGPETGLDPDENILVSKWLAEDGISYIHSSHLDFAAKSVKYPDRQLVKHLRDHLPAGLPLVVAGSVNSAGQAEQAMDMGADIVAIGRAAIGNRNLPADFKFRKALPFRTPYSVEHLRETGISESFTEYLKNSPTMKFLNVLR